MYARARCAGAWREARHALHPGSRGAAVRHPTPPPCPPQTPTDTVQRAMNRTECNRARHRLAQHDPVTGIVGVPLTRAPEGTAWVRKGCCSGGAKWDRSVLERGPLSRRRRRRQRRRARRPARSKKASAAGAQEKWGVGWGTLVGRHTACWKWCAGLCRGREFAGFGPRRGCRRWRWRVQRGPGPCGGPRQEFATAIKRAGHSIGGAPGAAGPRLAALCGRPAGGTEAPRAAMPLPGACGLCGSRR
jgi:hypothetical protein